MSFWDSTQGRIVRFETYADPNYPGWTWIDCGCSNGLEWGGEYPRECHTCGGNARIARHEDSRRLALYPGGPFVGREEKKACPV